MEKNNTIGQKLIEIMETGIKQMRIVIQEESEDLEEQITIESIDERLKQMQDQLNKIKDAII